MGMDRTTAPARVTDETSAPDRRAIHWVWPHPTSRPTPLDAAALSLGRGDDCDVRLSGTELSRRHAEIVRDGPIFVVRDLDSRNGVFLDGARIRQGPLGPGTVVRLGDAVGVVASLEDVTEPDTLGPGVVGGGALARAIAAAESVARSNLPLVILGETGTGKECLARAVHAWSERPGPFHAVNCAAIPETLAESELFGFRKGAFTGATHSSAGHLRASSGGTLLLDEITELALGVQAKLLRVLEEHEVQPLGDTRREPVDLRVICASQDSLEAAVAAGRFRADLFARLAGVSIELPPLRARKADVVALFLCFLRRHGGGAAPDLEARLVESLLLHDWPLNVRELETLARRMLAVHGHEGALRRAHLPQHLRARPVPSQDAERPAAAEPVTAEERDERDLTRLIEALRESAGNVSRAAAALGISRQRAYRLMNARAEIRLSDFRPDEGAE